MTSHSVVLGTKELTKKISLLLFIVLLIGCRPKLTPTTSPVTVVIPTATALQSSLTASPNSVTNEQTVANLTAFARLYGYIRFFHPSDEAVAADWDQIAIDGVRWVYEAQNSAELAERLETFFQPIAPTIRVFQSDKRPSTLASTLPPDGLATAQVVMWKHHSLGNDSRGYYDSILMQAPITDETVPAGFHDPRQPFHADLGNHVEADIPLALFVTSQGTFPAATSTAVGPAPDLSLGDEPVRRLAGTIIAWNAMQHFYPYFDVAETNWPAVLPEAITRTLAAPDEASYFNVLRWLVAQLNDGHGAVISPAVALPSEVPPVVLTWAEGKIVVLYVEVEVATHLPLGSIVLTIDGQSAEERLAEAETLISGATRRWKRFHALQRLLAGSSGSSVTLEVQTPDGRIQSVELTRDRSFHAINAPRPPMITELESGIFYIDLTRVSDSDIRPLLPQLATAQGIVFDLRGNEDFVHINLLGHLTQNTMTLSHFWLPIITMPDGKNMAFERVASPSIEPAEPYFEANVAFLADGSTFSFEETWLSYVANYQLAEIVGEATAGTNGESNYIKIPGWYQVFWTGSRVLRQDGSQHHGVGIQPTVPVLRTIAGIAAGEDEQLEAAVTIVSRE